jgi:hypothetical protein
MCCDSEQGRNVLPWAIDEPCSGEGKMLSPAHHPQSALQSNKDVMCAGFAGPPMSQSQQPLLWHHGKRERKVRKSQRGSQNPPRRDGRTGRPPSSHETANMIRRLSNLLCRLKTTLSKVETKTSGGIAGPLEVAMGGYQSIGRQAFFQVTIGIHQILRYLPLAAQAVQASPQQSPSL